MALEEALARQRRWPLYRRHLGIFLALALFSAGLEWHQTLIPGRACLLWDWVSTLIGTAVGLALPGLHLLRGRQLAPLSWQRGTPQRPDPSRPLILVADSHWSEELTGLREATRLHPEADWLFLGDVFDVWLGLPGLETEAQRSFLWWVQERRSAGRWVGLWGGNRDFFLDRLADRFDFAGEGAGGELPQEGLAFEHGDLVNAADRTYRLWNLLSRSGAMWLFFRALPTSWARRLVARLEHSLRTTNPSGKAIFPRDMFLRAVSAHRDQIFVTGHFHQEVRINHGVSLPWAHEGAFMVWHEGSIQPLSTSTPNCCP